MDWKLLLTPFNIIIAGSALILLILLVLIVLIGHRHILNKNLKALLKDPSLINGRLNHYFSKKRILSHSSQIEKVSIKHGLELLDITGINEFWLKELRIHKSRSLFERVLKYYPDKGLFTC